MLDYGELATMQTKIDMLNWVTGRTTAIFEWHVVMWLQEQMPRKTCVEKRSD